MPNNPLVLIVMGSDSDLPTLEGCFETLRKFHIPFHAEVCSAHRTPGRAAELASGARAAGIKVVIAAAGAAAHLAGVFAAHTTLPVIGIPCPSVLNGLDSLLSTVQMPAGIPVATVAIGKAGATNAALLAAQIISVADDRVARALADYKADMAQKIAEKNAALGEKLGNA